MGRIGTYQDTLLNSAGCDSVLVINLTINIDPLICGFAPCLESIDINPPFLAADPHQSLFVASDSIVAQGLVTNANLEDLTFIAGNSVSLIPEFEVQLGAQLSIVIQPCEE